MDATACVRLCSFRNVEGYIAEGNENTMTANMVAKQLGEESSFPLHCSERSRTRLQRTTSQIETPN